MIDDYKYDVAFSFCQEDENLAKEINNFLSSNLKVFIYSERQDELAGSDGEIEFKKTFSEYSRIVIVLFREKYGSTTWSRIEEEAIRSRAYEEGYDFTLYVLLDAIKNAPKYLPKTRIWYNLERFGIKGAASIISYMVNERGGDSRPESAKEKAAKIKQKLNFKHKLKFYKETHDAVEDALNEVKILFQNCEVKTREIFDGLNYGIKNDYRKPFQINYGDLFIKFSWTHYATNSLENSKLEITLGKYIYSMKAFETQRVHTIKNYEFDFEKNQSWENIWRLKSRNDSTDYYKTETLIEIYLSEFLNIIENELDK